VADPRKTAPPRPTPPRPASGDPGERLAELNDHLGRFLQHADQLLEEWGRFGAQVRTTVDGEVGRIDQAVSGAVDRAADRAGRELAGRLDSQVAERVDRALGEGVTRLRTDLDRLARTARGLADADAGGGRRDTGRLTLIAVVGANVMLAALLVLGVRDCDRGGSAPAPLAAPPPAVDAGAPAMDPAVEKACAALVTGWSDEAAALVVRVGATRCGPGADAVAARFAERVAPPPADAGVPPPDAGPPAEPAKRPKKKK